MRVAFIYSIAGLPTGNTILQNKIEFVRALPDKWRETLPWDIALGWGTCAQLCTSHKSKPLGGQTTGRSSQVGPYIDPNMAATDRYLVSWHTCFTGPEKLPRPIG